MRGDRYGKDNIGSWPYPTPQHPSVWGMRGFPPSGTQFRTWRIDFEYWICLGHQLNDGLATLGVRQRWPVASTFFRANHFYCID